MLGEPNPALAECHGMREYPANAGERRTRESHDRVMHGVQDLMREPKLAIAKRLVEKVVCGGDRADQGILDRQTPGLGPTFANCRNHILHLTNDP
jgi:hypothetical protein